MTEQVQTFVQTALQLYTGVAEYAVPAGLALGLCNIIVQMFFGAVFGGRVKVGSTHA